MIRWMNRSERDHLGLDGVLSQGEIALFGLLFSGLQRLFVFGQSAAHRSRLLVAQIQRLVLLALKVHFPS